MNIIHQQVRSSAQAEVRVLFEQQKLVALKKACPIDPQCPPHYLVSTCAVRSRGRIRPLPSGSADRRNKH